MLTESRSHGIGDMLKTVYPTKTTFCWGYKKGLREKEDIEAV